MSTARLIFPGLLASGYESAEILPPGTALATVKIGDLLDHPSMGPAQRIVFLLCGLAVFIDGADFQVIGFVAPSVMLALHIVPATMGFVFAAGIMGMMIGSLALAPLADRLGRRPLLIGSLLVFAAAMLATALVSSVWQLGLLRFVTGLGLGAIMPLATSLTGEYSPPSRRIARMVAVSTCFPLGAVAGGLAAAALIPAFGWRSVFLAGGLLPAALALAILVVLPESLDFLAGRKRHAAIARILARRLGMLIGPEVAFLPSDTPGRPSVRRLFEGGRTRATLVLWCVYSLNLLLLMFLSSWLPTLLLSTGRSARESILAGTVLQVGGTIGGLCMAYLAQRAGPQVVVAGASALAGGALLLVGVPAISTTAIFALVGFCGVTVIGGQQVLNGLAANLYPGHLRTTGAGWAMGVGRLGSIAGPVLAGLLLGANFGYGPLLQLAALPALASAALMLLMPRGRGTTMGDRI